MLGLLKKDMYLILNNINAIIIYILMALFFAMFLEMDISYILPFFFLSIYLSTFSYDEYNNFNGFACTMAKGRENVVIAKYLLTIITSLLVSIIPLLVNLFWFKTGLEDSLAIVFSSLFGLYLVVSLIYPLMFQFGAEKGRLALMGCFFAIGIICFLAVKLFDIDAASSIDMNYVLVMIGLVGFSFILLTISYLISKKIYSKKQF
ncbi:MAG: ABC-2 transporter permease [Erysipelotrichaceae bacterium]